MSTLKATTTDSRIANASKSAQVTAKKKEEAAKKKEEAAKKKEAALALKATMEETQVKRALLSQIDRMCTLASPCGMSVTSCQVFLLKEPPGKTRALARVVMNECMQLTGLKVMEGVNGLFVSYPYDPNYKGEDYRSLFYPATRGLREHIEQQVLLKYQETLDLNRQVS